MGEYNCCGSIGEELKQKCPGGDELGKGGAGRGEVYQQNGNHCKFPHRLSQVRQQSFAKSSVSIQLLNLISQIVAKIAACGNGKNGWEGGKEGGRYFS